MKKLPDAPSHQSSAPADVSGPDTALKGVKGWLLFFCVSLTILAPLATLGQLGMEWNETAPYFTRFPSLHTAVMLETLMSIGLMAFSIYAGSALWSVKPKAVKIAKNYLLTMLAYSIVSPFVIIGVADLPSAATSAMTAEGAKQAFRGLIGFAIWFTYLNRSKRVRATYPT
jgi:hypothetical protein